MDETIRKAAVLVASLDLSSADELLDRMDSNTAQQVRNAVMQLERISDQEETEVLADFLHTGRLTQVARDGGVELDISLAHKLAALPPEEMDAEAPVAEAGRFRFLDEATTDNLANYLRAERPQIIAVVMAHLPANRAADLLKRLAAPLQLDVLRRIAVLDRSDSAAVLDLEDSLRVALADEIRANRNRSTGLATVASILSAVGPDHQLMHAEMEGLDQDLAGGKQVHMDPPSPPAVADVPSSPPPRKSAAEVMPLTAKTPQQQPLAEVSPTVAFEQLSERPSADLAAVLLPIPRELLLLALAGATPRLLAGVFRSLPGKVTREIRRQMMRLGPLRLSDIEEAQRRIVRMVAAQSASGSAIKSPHRRFVAAA